MKKQNLRSMAAYAIENVVEHGQSLSRVLPHLQKKVFDDKNKTLLQELCFGILRTLSQMQWLIDKLMTRPLAVNHRKIYYLIIVGFYQLLHTRIPPYAAIMETVEGATVFKYPQFKKLINGILRYFQRHQNELLAEFAQSESRFLHPEWLLKRIQKAYPQDWKLILEANNQRPPMWLRVNRNHHSRDEWLALLKKTNGIQGFPHSDYPDAVRLAFPIPVNNLPGFKQGWVTVQDVSSQGCMTYLAPKNNEYILDLCAAPGGKTTHILEVAIEAKVLAVDINKQRLSHILDNLKRLGLKAKVKQGDGRIPSQWCGDKYFDRILLDAPCSATGVIRRHPDIKWLRCDSDIDKLVQLQAQILDAIWPHLKFGGTLLYATCSLLPEENTIQISAFLKRTPSAKLDGTGTSSNPGKQNLPSPKDGDGFFYAKLIKINNGTNNTS